MMVPGSRPTQSVSTSSPEPEVEAPPPPEPELEPETQVEPQPVHTAPVGRPDDFPPSNEQEDHGIRLGSVAATVARWLGPLATQLVEPREFDPDDEVGVVSAEHEEIEAGPGWKWNLDGDDDSKMRDVRDPEGRYNPGRGVTMVPDGPVQIQDLDSPFRKDGKWDPYQFMPHFVFSPEEDTFPVSPSFDGDADFTNNAPETYGESGGNYRDGVIGGEQALNGAFTVTQVDGYTVQTYSFYSAKDKGGQSYHPNDYHTAQVYLERNAYGNLEPKFLLTSFHHGVVLTPWKDLQKDETGHPIVEVKRGTHALRPLGHGDTAPTGGLEILGDGTTTLAGKPTVHRLTLDVFQSNILNARQLPPTSPAGQARLEMMEWGDVPLRPLRPSEFAYSEGWLHLPQAYRDGLLKP
jgi:hypothetical protein